MPPVSEVLRTEGSQTKILLWPLHGWTSQGAR